MLWGQRSAGRPVGGYAGDACDSIDMEIYKARQLLY